MKRVLVILLCLSMALIMLAGCSGGEVTASPTPTVSETTEPTEAPTPAPSPTEPPLVLSMASAGTLSGTNKGDALTKGIADLDSSSSGALTIDYYEGGEKGTDADIINAVKTGNVSIYIGDSSMIEAVIPQLALLELPMMFKSLSACNIMLSGSFTDMMQPYFNEAGLELVGAYSPAFRHLTLKVEEHIAVAKDLKGLKVNVEDNQYSKLFWKTIGCSVYSFTDNQLFTATKQLLINGQENTYAVISRLKLYDSQSDLIKTRHSQPVTLFVMNKAQYDALTDEQSEWLKKFVSQVGQDEIAAVAEDETSQETTFKKKLLKPYEPSAEILAALKAAVQPVVDLMKQSLDPALVDQYIAACGQAETDAANAAAVPTTEPDSSASPTTEPDSSASPTASAQ